LDIVIYISKETIRKVKRRSKKWEKILAKYVSDKKLTSIIYVELCNSTIKIQINQIKHRRKT
jgi:hypothetical protein